jgi:hypothetical protein
VVRSEEKLLEDGEEDEEARRSGKVMSFCVSLST